MFIKIDNLTKKFGDLTAVDNLSFEVNKGELICVLGPSGCGKSTTLRMIAGLETVTKGDIILDGKSIVGLEPKDREISMIFQSYAVWPHMSVKNNIAYPLKLRKMSKEKIEKIVNKVAEISDISNYLNRYPHQLSGGQRQRVAVARAIAVEPKLFLLDEPLSNLDAKLRVAMRTDLKKIHQEIGSTSIFVTHDQSEALSIADKIVVMNKGVIEQIGTPNEIYHNSKTMFIAKFIGNPPSNFFNVKVVKKNQQIILENKHFKFVPNEEQIEKLEKQYLDKEIILSVRPEQILINSENYLFKTKPILIEPQGSHIIINTKIGSTEFKIQTNYLNILDNDDLYISFTNKYQLFDLETEQSIF